MNLPSKVALGGSLCIAAGIFAVSICMSVGYIQQPEAPKPLSLEQQLDNVVSIYNKDGYCSGWVLKGSHTVVTAAHCVDKTDPTQTLLVDFNDGTGKHNFHIQYLGDTAFKQGADLMTLTTSDATVKWPAGLPVCTFKPYYGQKLNLLGGPLGYEKSATFGSVSNPDRNLDDSVMGPFGHFIQYDGTLLPGNSGGPAVDAKEGCVVGVGELNLVNQDSAIPYWISFLTPINYLKDLTK